MAFKRRDQINYSFWDYSVLSEKRYDKVFTSILNYFKIFKESRSDICITGIAVNIMASRLKRAIMVNNNICFRMPDNSIRCYEGPDINDPHAEIVLGREMELALLFLDVRNFTKMMSLNLSYEILFIIKRLFGCFSKAIKQAGGKIVEVNGDSIYAAFGMDSQIHQAVENAVSASSEIFRALDEFNQDSARNNNYPKLEIGVGIHEGLVMISECDLDYSGHLTVMGLPVNIASRLQSETKVLNNDLLISEEAYALLGYEQDSHDVQTVKLKGIEQPQMIRLLGRPYQNLLQKQATDLFDELEYYLSIAG